MRTKTLSLIASTVLHNLHYASAFHNQLRFTNSLSKSFCSTNFAVRRPRLDVPDFTILDDNNEEEGWDSNNERETGKSPELSDHSSAPDVASRELKTDRRGRSDRGSRRQGAGDRKKDSLQSASWMQRNKVFANDNSDDWNDRNTGIDENVENANFRQNFRGTRVFVTGLPDDVTWQTLKDHFRQAGEVVFASVSADMETGKSKGYGVVQYETTHEAQKAIETMREYPLNGSQLYVRPDVQEKQGKELGTSSSKGARGPTPPSKWKCANEENISMLSESERKAILSLIKARDDARRRRQYDASDTMREELKIRYNVHLDDRLKMWWSAIDGNQVPQSIQEIKGDGRWGDQKPWRQIPTTPENDASVDPDLVNGLLTQRDIARREKDFKTADVLLEQARNSPSGDLFLRIHDESRTWRIWTNDPPLKAVRHQKGPAEQCLDLLEEFAPHKVDEMKVLLEKFPGREYNILKKLKQLYLKE
ncbi:heterogeneous nuclear ribonucleoprotein M [Fistulifera solaris]|uniref:Heterogeneous nuclear ribonucleoprotein M n=1 Tax=Fistulifera solaris TaxID=1519565 RepID=A0A1Z5K020_FISSO|nr:heterogeneous nuclear ribonucleoprotein M [Fistulifera solaris]|eukprot:GAX19624.1 heterogeneous nuclear ribonucleoprotein M [Fistulifera solaris]